MRRPSLGAALPAILITIFLRFLQTNGLHLVSNQPSGTNNQNNTPVHYVPNMATKLGLPQPQNRESEISLSDEALAAAVRQLIESHERQTTFLERLAALTPKSKMDESYPPAKRKIIRQPKITTLSSQKPTESASVIMRPANAKVVTADTSYSLEPRKILETDAKSNATVEKVSSLSNLPQSVVPQLYSQTSLLRRPNQNNFVPSNNVFLNRNQNNIHLTDIQEHLMHPQDQVSMTHHQSGNSFVPAHNLIQSPIHNIVSTLPPVQRFESSAFPYPHSPIRIPEGSYPLIHQRYHPPFFGPYFSSTGSTFFSPAQAPFNSAYRYSPSAVATESLNQVPPVFNDYKRHFSVQSHAANVIPTNYPNHFPTKMPGP